MSPRRNWSRCCLLRRGTSDTFAETGLLSLHFVGASWRAASGADVDHAITTLAFGFVEAGVGAAQQVVGALVCAFRGGHTCADAADLRARRVGRERCRDAVTQAQGKGLCVICAGMGADHDEFIPTQ